MSFSISKIELQKSKQFSKLMLDYVSNSSDLQPLINQHFSSVDMKNLINGFTFENRQRLMLSDELLKQYEGFELSNNTKENILSLKKDNTFTITTGHQLCLFTGPLYFIYKIISVIVQCEELNKKHADYCFVPVYWLAGEDHDKEEINHAFVFGKRITWQTDQKGKVGKFNLEGINEAVSQLKVILGNSLTTDSIIHIIEKAYSLNNLNDATKYLVNELFGQFGLVIIDPDYEPFKKIVAADIARELKTSFIEKKVNETNSYLIKIGYKPQVNPRSINLFYAKDEIRERIVFSENCYRVLNTEISFSEIELENYVENNIASFSPNVLMRPLFQQKILPNLFYVGGPGEIAYWLQLKSAFNAANVFFPVLQPRKFALLLNEKHLNKLYQIGLSIEDLFLNGEELEKKIVASEFSGYEDEKNEIEQLFNTLKNKLIQIDQTLSGTVDAEKQKTIKGIETIEQKAKRSLKQKNEIQIQQIKKIKNTYFSDQTIQERKDNFLNFYSQETQFIHELKIAFTESTSDESNYLVLY